MKEQLFRLSLSLNVALVQPSLEDFYTTSHRLSGLGLHVVEKIIREQGHQATVFHFLRHKSRTISLPFELNPLKPYLMEQEKSPVSFFTQYRRFGPSVSEMANQILASRPDLILISCFAYAYADVSRQLIVELKKQAPHIPVALGGAGASVYPSYFAGSGVDNLLVGEAEDTLPLLLNQSLTTAGGLIKAMCPGEKNPRAVLSGVTAHHYAFSFLRGCRYQCKFCSQRLTHGNNFRKASWEEIIACFSAISMDHEPSYINFEDDNLLDERELWFELLIYLKNRYPTIRFGAENGLNYSQLDENTLSFLIGIGFESFNLSYAVNAAGAQKQQRFFNAQKLEEALARIASHGKDAIVYFIAGLEQTTPQDTLDTLLYLNTLPCRLGISPFYAVPGMSGFEENTMEQVKPIFFRASSLYPWTGTHSSAELLTAFRLSRTVNFMKENAHHPLSQTIMKEKRLYTSQHGEIVPVKKIDEPMLTYFFDHFKRF